MKKHNFLILLFFLLPLFFICLAVSRPAVADIGGLDDYEDYFIENRIQVEIVDDRAIAIRSRGGDLSIGLSLNEQVRSVKNLGIVGAVLTDSRFLVVSVTSEKWRSVPLALGTASSAEIHVSEKMALLLTSDRAVGFDGISNTLTRFDIPLGEQVVAQGLGRNLLVFATGRRAAALAVGGSQWVPVDFHIGEIFQSLDVESRLAVVRTSERLLNFHAIGMFWQKITRPIGGGRTTVKPPFVQNYSDGTP